MNTQLIEMLFAANNLNKIRAIAAGLRLQVETQPGEWKAEIEQAQHRANETRHETGKAYDAAVEHLRHLFNSEPIVQDVLVAKAAAWDAHWAHLIAREKEDQLSDLLQDIARLMLDRVHRDEDGRFVSDETGKVLPGQDIALDPDEFPF